MHRTSVQASKKKEGRRRGREKGRGGEGDEIEGEGGRERESWAFWKQSGEKRTQILEKLFIIDSFWEKEIQIPSIAWQQV